ncbi:MAG: PAS domain S-box protein [Oscillatoriaceae cyanobacterium Prado104]|jgi:PAS domain S-box-containing protein|nr:PAS domain S-box protein [Oscillatoriaceae cyanobacterium Prado104]
MSEIPRTTALQLTHNLDSLQQAEAALKIAWEQLEQQIEQTIAQTAAIVPNNARQLRDCFDRTKQLCHEFKTQMKQTVSRLNFHVENSPMAVIEWDNRYRIIRWSPQAEKMFGWKNEETVGKDWHDFSIVDEAEGESVNLIANKLLEGSESRSISCHRNYTKDGSIIYCEWYSSTLKDPEGKVISVLSFAIDASERICTQEELHRRERYFSAIAENSTDIIARYDRELRHLYVNRAIETATGKFPAEFIGKTNKESGMPVDFCKLFDEYITQVFLTGQPETIEFEFLNPQGIKHYHCRVLPEFTGDNSIETVLTIARDITELKQVELHLRHSESKFRSIVNSNLMGIFFWDIDGNILDANDFFLNTVNYTRNDLISGRINWQEMTPPEYQILDAQKLAELIVSRMVVPFAKEYVRSDGSRVPVLLGGTLLEGSQNLGVSFVLDLTDRKQAEFELQKQQELLESILKTIPNFLYIYDTESNKIIYISESVTTMLGYTAQELEEFVTAAVADLVHPEDRPKLIAGIQKLKDSMNSQEIDDRDYRIKHKNGEWRWVHDRARIFKNNSEGKTWQIIGSVLDISDRKAAEASLKQQKEVLQTIFDNVPVMLGFLNKNSEIEWVNRHWEEVLGWSCEEMKSGDIFAEFYPDPEYRQYVLDEVQAANRNWSDFKTKVKDGRIIDTCWANINLSDGSRIGIGQDITKRKIAEAELKELNETLEAQVAQRTAELETFFDALPDYIFVVERENMRLSFVNHTMAKFSGFDSRQQMQGKTIFECYPSELAERFYQKNIQVFESGKTLHLQDKFVKAAGSVYLDTFKIPLRNLDGEVYALIGTSRNITELVETKQALSERTVQLEAANKELESFCYSVSHDLRAPLRHISGFVSALKQRLETSEAARDRKIVHYIEVIEDSSQKMSLLIDGLLMLSRVGRAELMQIPIDLDRLVQTAIKLAKPRTGATSSQIPQNVEFEIGNLPAVTGDPTLLQQVFSNLIGNAVKFSRDRDPARVVIDSLPDGTIFVKDNGAGFDMTYADRLFGAFQRLHSQREFEGTGIGLAIVQRIIHRHGGKIWAESLPGQGATFYFKLSQTISMGNVEF